MGFIPLPLIFKDFSPSLFTVCAPDIRKNVIDTLEIRTVNFFNSDHINPFNNLW